MKAGAAKKVIETTGKLQAGPARPVTVVLAPGTIQAGAAQPVQIVDSAFTAAHGLKAGDPQPVYLTTTGKTRAGAAVPVYVTNPAVIYYHKVLNTSPTTLIAYWPLWETGGVAADNLQGNAARDGAYHNVTLGAAGIGDGRTAARFDGSTSYLTLPAALSTAFNKDEGTISGWFIGQVATWNNTTARTIFHLGQDAPNRWIVFKSTTNTFRVQGRANNVTLVDRTMTTSATTPVHFAVTWSASAGVGRVFFNGVKISTDATWNNTYVGSVSTYRSIGSTNAGSALNVWLGDIAHVALWSSALTPGQIASLAVVG